MRGGNSLPPAFASSSITAEAMQESTMAHPQLDPDQFETLLRPRKRIRPAFPLQ